MIENYLTLSQKVARYFIASAMIVFGIQHIVYQDLITRIFPKSSFLGTQHIFWAYTLGGFLIVGGVAILNKKTSRSASLLLGGGILTSFLLLYVPMILTRPINGGLYTAAGKALALSGGCFLLAGSLKNKSDDIWKFLKAITKILERVIPYGRFFLAAFLILAGIQHFIYVNFVVRLIPSWIPGQVFWVYFTAIALIAGGIGICIKSTRQKAGLLTGLMILSWVILLHLPRVLADMQHPNETTALFEALAFSGVAFLAAK